MKDLPAGLLPTTIAKDIGKRIHTTGCLHRQNKQTVQETNTYAMFKKIHPVFRDYYKYTNPTKINEGLKKSIHEKTAYAVVDGSFDPEAVFTKGEYFRHQKLCT